MHAHEEQQQPDLRVHYMVGANAGKEHRREASAAAGLCAFRGAPQPCAPLWHCCPLAVAFETHCIGQ